MHGNVWEWCQDHWHSNYDSAPADGSAWLSGDEGKSRILRGGSWDFNPWDCRSASRYVNSPHVASSGVGFRVVSSLVDLRGFENLGGLRGDKRGWVSLCGGLVFGKADAPRDAQIEQGVAHYQRLREHQQQVKAAIAVVEP